VAESVYKQLFVRDRWIAARTLYGQTVGKTRALPNNWPRRLPLEVVLEALAYCESKPVELAQAKLYAAHFAELSLRGELIGDRLTPRATSLGRKRRPFNRDYKTKLYHFETVMHNTGCIHSNIWAVLSSAGG